MAASRLDCSHMFVLLVLLLTLQTILYFSLSRLNNGSESHDQAEPPFKRVHRSDSHHQDMKQMRNQSHLPIASPDGIPLPWSSSADIPSDLDGCTFASAEMTSALQRVKLPSCEARLRRAACLSQLGLLYPPQLSLQPMPRCILTPSQPLKDWWTGRGVGEGAAVLPDELQVPSPTRLAFMLVVHGRNVRQIKRLLRAIYSTEHYYLIHVDARSNYMHRSLAKELKTSNLSNVRLSSFRLPSVWGASNLYEVYFRGMADMAGWVWDYFINLSGADFPIVPVDELTAFLGVTKLKQQNLLKSHGSNHPRFIKKQGLDKTFVLCDEHMYRIGDRFVPPHLAIEGGSDWFMLHRTYVDYLLSQPPLVSELRRYYDFSLLSAESFFHVVAANTAFCPSIVDSNFRYAFWQRKRGCQCQHKAVVDWCGCSPMVFRRDDYGKLKTNSLAPAFIARKFDLGISHVIFNKIEARLLKLPIIVSQDYAWSNVHHHADDKRSPGLLLWLESFVSMAQQALQILAPSSQCQLSSYRVLEAYALLHNDTDAGYTLQLEAYQREQRMLLDVHVQAKPLPVQQPSALILQSMPVASRFVTAQVGTQWDVKERVFNRRGGLLTTLDTIVLTTVWKEVEQDSEVAMRLLDPTLHVRDSRPFTVGAQQSHLHIPAPLAGKQAAGLWRFELRPASDLDATGPAFATIVFPVLSTEDAPSGLVEQFWAVNAACNVQLSCLGLPVCQHSGWSSMAYNADINLADL
eukprot:m.126143 g.126143  ORF g.126143 m.126143 type:complete len:745 (+) comp15766_c0_seq1:143-2377(+)